MYIPGPPEPLKATRPRDAERTARLDAARTLFSTRGFTAPRVRGVEFAWVNRSAAEPTAHATSVESLQTKVLTPGARWLGPLVHRAATPPPPAQGF